MGRKIVSISIGVVRINLNYKGTYYLARNIEICIQIFDIISIADMIIINYVFKDFVIMNFSA